MTIISSLLSLLAGHQQQPCWLCYRSHWPGARSPTTTTTTTQQHASSSRHSCGCITNSRSLSPFRLYIVTLLYSFQKSRRPNTPAIPHLSRSKMISFIISIRTHAKLSTVGELLLPSFPPANQMDRKLSSCFPFTFRYRKQNKIKHWRDDIEQNETDLAKHKSVCNTHQQWWLCVLELMDKGGLCCYSAGQWLYRHSTLANQPTNLTHSTQDFCDYRARPSPRKWIISFYGLVARDILAIPRRTGSAHMFSTGFWLVHPFDHFNCQSMVNIHISLEDKISSE